MDWTLFSDDDIENDGYETDVYTSISALCGSGRTARRSTPSTGQTPLFCDDTEQMTLFTDSER